MTKNTKSCTLARELGSLALLRAFFCKTHFGIHCIYLHDGPQLFYTGILTSEISFEEIFSGKCPNVIPCLAYKPSTDRKEITTTTKSRSIQSLYTQIKCRNKLNEDMSFETQHGTNKQNKQKSLSAV